MCPLWPLHWVLMLFFLLWPLWFISCEAAKAAAQAAAHWGVEFSPDTIMKLQEGQSQKISFTTNDITPQDTEYGIAYVIISDPNIVYSSLKEYKLKVEPIDGYNWISSFNITGNFLGYTDVKLRLQQQNEKGILSVKESDSVKVSVIRKPSVMDKIFTTVVIVLVSIVFINFGCALDILMLKRAIIKPIGPIIGLLCHYLILPLFSFGIGLLLFPNNVALRLGVFFTGISPAGGASNIWTATLGGNLSLSVTMTAVSTLASFVMIPLWVLTLGQAIFSGGSVGVPYNRIMTSSIGLFVPLGVGYLIQVYCKRFSNLMVRILKPFSALLIVFIIIFAIMTNFYLFQLFTWEIVLVGLSLPLFGYFCGWALSSLMSQPGEDVLATSIETGVQNTGIAIFLLRFCLEQPEADLTTVAPVVVALMTPIPVLILYIIRRLRGDMKKEYDKSVHNEPNNKITITSDGVHA